MRKKVWLPRSLKELQRLDGDAIKKLWLRYFKELPPLYAQTASVNERQELANSISDQSEKSEKRITLADDKLKFCRHAPIQIDQKVIRTLWYKVQCETRGLRVEQKHVTMLNRYSANPDKYVEKSFKTKYHIRSGTEIFKTYKGRQYTILIKAPDEIVYNNTTYRTLSAAALAICHKKVSGYDFFGLNNKLFETNVTEKGGDEQNQMEEDGGKTGGGGSDGIPEGPDSEVTPSNNPGPLSNHENNDDLGTLNFKNEDAREMEIGEDEVDQLEGRPCNG